MLSALNHFCRFWRGILCVFACSFLHAPASAQQQKKPHKAVRAGGVTPQSQKTQNPEAAPPAKQVSPPVALLFVARGSVTRTDAGEQGAKPAASVTWLRPGDRLQFASAGSQVDLVQNESGEHCRVVGPGTLLVRDTGYLIKGAKTVTLPAIDVSLLKPMLHPPSVGGIGGDVARGGANFRAVSPQGVVRSLENTAELRWENPAGLPEGTPITVRLTLVGGAENLLKADVAAPIHSLAVPSGLLPQGRLCRWTLECPGAGIPVDFLVLSPVDLSDLEAAERAARAFPENDLTRNLLLAKCYQAFGMHTEALAQYSDALQKAPDDAAILQARSDTYKRLTGKAWERKPQP